MIAPCSQISTPPWTRTLSAEGALDKTHGLAASREGTSEEPELPPVRCAYSTFGLSGVRVRKLDP